MEYTSHNRLFAKKILVFLFFAGLVIILLSSSPAITQAQDPSYGLGTTATHAGFSPTTDPQERFNLLVASIINTVIGLAGIIFLIMVVASGELWMTAAGNEEKIGKARAMLFNGIVGLIIALSAYVTANFVLKLVLGSVGVPVNE